MQISNEEIMQIIKETAKATANAIVKKMERKGYLESESASKGASSLKKGIQEKSAYAQTEALLFNYRNFQRIVAAKKREIEDIKQFGVPQKGGAVVTYSGGNGSHKGLELEEERKQAAIHSVEKSMESTVDAIALIDKCLATFKGDPYYRILEMRYFEGRTQEDIALEFDCTQQNIAYHKSRLVKALATTMFPDKVVSEFFG